MQLFLTSSINTVAHDVAQKIGDVSGLKLVFITTAAETYADNQRPWFDKDRLELIRAGFKLTDYTITKKNSLQIEHDLEQFDVICVEGGNTVHLTKIMHEVGAIKVFRNLVTNKNKIYIGSSAGSMVAGSSIEGLEELDEIKHSPSNTKCLNFVPFAIAPHWGSHDFKTGYQNLWSQYYTEKTPFVMLPDKSYLWVRDEVMELVTI